jgi:hypothetical protein
MRSSHWTAFGIRISLGTVLAVGWCSSGVVAGILATTPHALDNDLGPGPGGAWQGSVVVSGTSPNAGGIDSFEATVDYAVFARGKIQNFFDDNWGVPPVDPAPDDIVYAYQIHTVTADTTRPGAAPMGIQKMTVGLDAGDLPGVLWLPTFQSNPAFVSQQNPSSTGGAFDPVLNGSAIWNFTGSGAAAALARVNTGEQSPILLYSAKYLPDLNSVTLTAGIATAAVNSVPSIGNVAIPEPSAILMCLLGAGTLVAVRRRV